jgi:phosphoglycerate dehydrogenase-like enzyme
VDGALVADMSIGDFFHHPIMLHGRLGCRAVRMRNLRLFDAGQQFVKGTSGGSGRIGAAVARRFARGFDCHVLYSNRSGPDAELDEACGASWAPLEDLLRAADIVVVLCARTPETAGLLSAERLALLKPDALFVNAARGGVVDQAALVALLRARPGMKAGLDVTTPEPLPLDSELLALPNCLVLPHIGSAGESARRAMLRLSLENALAGLEGRPLTAEAPCPPKL